MEVEIEEQNRKGKEKRSLERENLKTAMEVQIPETVKCKYKKIKQNRIKERESNG